MIKYGKRFKEILDEARKSPGYWAEDAWLDLSAELAKVVDDMILPSAEKLTLTEMSRIAFSFGKRVKITLEDILEGEQKMDDEINQLRAERNYYRKILEQSFPLVDWAEAAKRYLKDTP